MPGISTLFAIAGALIGTAINIIIPALFYNRAYAEEHISKDSGAKLVTRGPEEDKRDLLEDQDEPPAVSYEDKRKVIRQLNHIFIAFGVIFALYSFVIAIKNASAEATI